MNLTHYFENNESLRNEMINAARGVHQRRLVKILLSGQCPKSSINRGWSGYLVSEHSLTDRINAILKKYDIEYVLLRVRDFSYMGGPVFWQFVSIDSSLYKNRAEGRLKIVA